MAFGTSRKTRDKFLRCASKCREEHGLCLKRRFEEQGKKPSHEEKPKPAPTPVLKTKRGAPAETKPAPKQRPIEEWASGFEVRLPYSSCRTAQRAASRTSSAYRSGVRAAHARPDSGEGETRVVAIA